MNRLELRHDRSGPTQRRHAGHGTALGRQFGPVFRKVAAVRQILLRRAKQAGLAHPARAAVPITLSTRLRNDFSASMTTPRYPMRSPHVTGRSAGL